VAEAIDRLEAELQNTGRQNTDATDLAARVAAVWSMVTEIDPELARLASGYVAGQSQTDPGRSWPGSAERGTD
jgi:hypothetical protein